MDRKPLVLAAGQLQQLQRGDDLDIPLEERHAALERKFRVLLLALAGQGWPLPAELLGEIDQL